MPPATSSVVRTGAQIAHLANTVSGLPFFDDIRRVAAADVLHRVDRSGRDEQDVAGLEAR
jgi:hypothetical protein